MKETIFADNTMTEREQYNREEDVHRMTKQH